MSPRKKYGYYSALTGLVLAILFAILAGVDASNRGGYIGALVACVVAGGVGLVIGLTAS